MNSDGIKAIKNELRNYHYYYKKYEEIRNELEWRWYRLTGVHSPDPTKIPMESYNPSYTEQMKLQALEEIEELEAKKERVCQRLDYVTSILDQFEEDMRQPTIDIYIRGKTFYATGIKYNLSSSYLQYRIDKNISDIIKKGGD